MDTSNWGNDWNDAMSDPGDGGSASLFVDLKTDGATIDFVPLTSPRERWLMWPEGPGRPDECEPGTPGGTCTYIIQAYDVNNVAVRILDLKPGAFRALRDEIKRDGPRNVFRLRRKGTGNKTEWVCMTRQAAPASAYKLPLQELTMSLCAIGEGRKRRLAAMDAGAAAMPPAGPHEEDGRFDEEPPF